MKILVAIKRVVDHNVRVYAKLDGSGVDTDNAKFSINPFDEVALEEAIRIRESGSADEVIAVSCGRGSCQDVLRTSLAHGADRAIHVDTGGVDLQPLAVAKLLKKVCEVEGAGFVLMGKQAIDDDASQTGPMLAALMGWPQATNATAITIGDGEINVTRGVDGGAEYLSIQLPAVITVDLRMNEPRYVTLPNIMKAKKKPLEVRSADSLGVDLAPRLTVVAMAEPAARGQGVLVSGVPELIDRLRNEAGVL